MKRITIYDSTLRDGNHAVKQQISEKQIVEYSRLADKAGVPYLEIGHGNGLGASSIQVGKSPMTTNEMIKIARPHLHKTKLSTFMLPGWGTILEINQAIDDGIDAIRVGAHCTEANLTERYINHISANNIEVHGILVMSHMTSPELLAEQASLLEKYGADAVGIFDSSGHFLPNDVRNRIAAIRSLVKIPIIFHGHNNLGMAIENSLTAIETGADILDACILGFGAGAGNTQLEVLVAVLHKLKYQTDIDFNSILDVADNAKSDLGFHAPSINSESIVSGLSGVFSGFRNQVLLVAKELKINPRELFYELGNRQAIAGQEDLVIEIAQSFKKRSDNHLQ